MWSLVAFVIGADNRPTSFTQHWCWVARHLKNRNHYYTVGLAAICWAIWKSRNNLCFEGKLISSPTEIICSASSFISYRAGLQKGSGQEELAAGAEALKTAALHFHPQDTGEDAGTVLLQ